MWDQAHHVVSLDQLLNTLRADRTQLRKKAYSYEEDLSTLIKYSTKVLSGYETKTEEMILQLHATRDEQVLYYYILLGMNRYCTTIYYQK